MSTVYQIRGPAGQSLDWRPTQAEARAVRDWWVDNEGGEYEFEIVPVKVLTTREGLCRILNAYATEVGFVQRGV